MDNDADSTFCKVCSPEDRDGLEADQIVSDINDITVKEESPNAITSNQCSGVLWTDGLPNVSSSKKETTVGSLSFSVVDTAPSNQLLESTTQAVSGNAEKSPEQKNSIKKPTARAKIALEKGYSQMDWLKLTQSHPDLAGLKGQSNRRLISMVEVRQHQTEGQMWTVLKGRIYNLSPYMNFHPGGADILMKAVGKDCTSLFNKYHAWVNAEFLLQKCLVGTLDDSK